MRVTAALIILAACMASPASARCHHCRPYPMHRYWNYPGDQVNPWAVERYGPPENGGYRYGGKVNGHYNDETHYED